MDKESEIERLKEEIKTLEEKEIKDRVIEDWI
jgi:hypothetical protein